MKTALTYLNRSLCWSAGGVLTVMFSQSALADLVGVQAEIRTDLTICQDTSQDNIDVPLLVCDVYAVFDDPADRLLTVVNNGIGTTDPQGFYQHPFNFTPIAPACAAIPVFPDLVCDSFVTIGLECGLPGGDGTSTDGPGECGINPHWPCPIGGWFNNNPDNGQGDAGAYPDLRVLLAQLSVAEGHDVSGSLDVFIRFGDEVPPLIVLFEDLEFECAGSPPSECNAKCSTDVDHSGETDAFDLAVLLGCWGPVTPGAACECLDADEDLQIGAADLAVLLGAWGSCP